MSQMGAEFQVGVVRPAELDAHARDLWARFRAADPAYRSPYFDLRYVLAAAEVAPGAALAVLRRDEEIVGFLPFQRRGVLIQPLGAPLTDYHGVLAAPGVAIDLAALTRALGARRFRFESLVVSGRAPEGLEMRQPMAADLSDGFEAYAGRRPTGFLKDKRRRTRRLAEDHGPLEFTFGPAGEEVLDLILRLKRDQMRRTAQHDIFASGWTIDLLRRLSAAGEADFGLRYAVLRVGGKIVAAEAGLQSGDDYHLWLPVYDADFKRYSPGSLMTLETLRHAADQGLRRVDFGSAGETYKTDFADPGPTVYAGQVSAAGPAGRGMTAAGRKLLRRWDRIAACEPRLDGQAIAASQSLGRLGRRHPKTTIGFGLGLGASLGLLTLISD